MAYEGEGPQLGFDRLLAELVEQGTSIMATRSRLRDLVGVNRELTSHLDLSTVLHRIVEIGAELVGSKYAAMVVLGADGALESFTHVGMTDEQVAAIPRLPAGEGLLGALLKDPRPLRLNHMAADHRSEGFPPNHPPMTSFLGVPILLRGELFGNLYLTESVNGSFSADDEELAVALADTAGIAIENARLYEESQHRQRVSTSMVKLSRTMSRSEDIDPVDDLLTEVRQHFDVDMINVSMLSEDRSEIFVDHVQGFGAEGVVQTTFPIAGSPLREAMVANEDRITYFEDISSELPYGFEELKDLGSFIGAPFVVDQETAGFLCIVRLVGRPQFTERDARTAESFATQLSVIYERRRARESRRRLSLLEDRERIARDLHDHVIQRLFATGMNLQVVAGQMDEQVASMVEKQIEEIDGAIAQIRQSIFAIRASEQTSGSRLRPRIIEVVERMNLREVHPTVTFLGPVDLLVEGDLTDDVVAVVTEGLANAVRHARATAISVSVQAGDGRVQVDVIDDGRGIPEDAVVRGLDNLRARATTRGGELTITSSSSDGTRLTWTAATD